MKRYKELKHLAKKGKIAAAKSIENMKRGRPLLLGGVLDEKVNSFLRAVRHRGGVVNSTIAIATAKPLIDHGQEDHLKGLVINQSWAQSFFRRMKFCRRMQTTSKVPIPEKARQEIELIFMHRIVQKVEQHSIPPSMLINIDQTPLKMVPVSRTTKDARNSTRVPIAGSGDKRTITGTFSQSLDGNFIPPQLIYKRKTSQSLPKTNFPKGFSLSVNPTHFSNTEETLNLLSDIIIPYMEEQREKLGLPNQKGLLYGMPSGVRRPHQFLRRYGTTTF